MKVREAGREWREGFACRIPAGEPYLCSPPLTYLVHYVLFKRQTKAQVDVRAGDIEKIVRQSTVVGLSTAEEGLQTVRAVLDLMRQDSTSGELRTSDITGLDWSLGALGGAHGYLTILSASDPHPQRHGRLITRSM